MPVIHVQLTAGAFDDTEKQAMIEKLTEAMVSVQGEALRPVTSVTLEDVDGGHWGMGGQPMPTGDVAGLRATAPAGLPVPGRYAF